MDKDRNLTAKFVTAPIISTNVGSLIISVGKSKSVTRRITDPDRSEHIIRYGCENKNIATAESDGNGHFIITGVSEGETKLLIKVYDKANNVLLAIKEVTITVDNKYSVQSVDLSNATIRYRDSSMLFPKIDVGKDTEYTVTYTSSAKGIVSVDQNGRISSPNVGHRPFESFATITVTVTDDKGNTVSDTCTVDVEMKFWQWLIVVLLFGWIWY